MKIISFSLCVFFKHKWNDDEVEQSIITWITHKHVSMPFLKNELFHHKHVFVFLKLFQSIQQTNITHFILNITRDWSFHTEFHFTLLTINLILNILEYLQLCNNISNLGMFCCFPSQTCGVWKRTNIPKSMPSPVLELDLFTQVLLNDDDGRNNWLEKLFKTHESEMDMKDGLNVDNEFGLMFFTTFFNPHKTTNVEDLCHTHHVFVFFRDWSDKQGSGQCV